MQPIWTLRFDGLRNLLHVRLEGPHTEWTVRAVLDAASSAGEYQPGMNQLWDVREADLSVLDGDAVQHLVEHMVSLPLEKDVKVAIVAVRPLEFGLARISQAYFDDLATTTTRAFDSAEEAEAWLLGAGSG